ncbi:MAG: aminotransferase class V-fold PLP-dependent enzyme [Nitrososphaerales archaeon]
MNRVEEEFPVKATQAYFNNASYTPMSKSAIKAITRALEEYSLSGPSDEYYLKLKEGGNAARAVLSKVLHVQENSLVFTESATQSINLVANGFKLSRGDAVITRGGASEHPSNYLPWQYYVPRKGARIIDLPTDSLGFLDLSELDSELKKSHAKLVVVSHVLYNLGTIQPVEEIGKIIHERGALFFLDVSQSIGNIEVDLSRINCDYAAGTAAKWICGPLGLGLFYCKQQALGYLDPLNFGPNACTYTPDGKFNESDTVLRLQEGFRNWAYCHGLVAAISLITQVGQTNITKHNIELGNEIIQSLSNDFKFIGSTDPQTRTSILPFETRAKPSEIVSKLGKQKITVAEREIKEKKILRISPHFYNDAEETNRLISALNS